MPTARQIANLKKAQDHLEEVWMSKMDDSEWSLEDLRNIKDARRALYAVEMRWDDIKATQGD
jgi:hypothetical protein